MCWRRNGIRIKDRGARASLKSILKINLTTNIKHDEIMYNITSGCFETVGGESRSFEINILNKEIYLEIEGTQLYTFLNTSDLLTHLETTQTHLPPDALERIERLSAEVFSVIKDTQDALKVAASLKNGGLPDLNQMIREIIDKSVTEDRQTAIYRLLHDRFAFNNENQLILKEG